MDESEARERAWQVCNQCGLAHQYPGLVDLVKAEILSASKPPAGFVRDSELAAATKRAEEAEKEVQMLRAQMCSAYLRFQEAEARAVAAEEKLVQEKQRAYECRLERDKLEQSIQNLRDSM